MRERSIDGTRDHAVVIAGGGPTGLMLAAELALAGVDVAIVEPREDQTLEGLRARGIHARTIEVLDQRGVAERFLARGRTAQLVSFGGVPLDMSDFPTRHPYGLALAQQEIEHLLAEWVGELEVSWLRGREVVGFTQDDGGVDCALSDGTALRAAYLVGCDGGRSVVRCAAEIELVGSEASTSYLIAEASMSEEPPVGVHHHDRGMRAIGKLADGRVNVVLGEPYAGPLGAATASELSGALVAAYGRDFGVHDITWLSRFTDAALQATTYRDRRVLIAGDAAHVHSPMGGQGLNLGVQDAVNLGWKLAQVVRGTSDDRLLDTYEAERHPVGASVLRTTLALTAISRGDDRTQALRETLSEVLRMDGPRRHLAAMSSGLDLRYDLGDGHPLLGRRMPDLELVVDGGPRRLFTFLHSARPVLLDLGGDVDVGAWADRVPRIVARYEGAWALPVIGEVAAPRAVLVRPDGHVAWVAEGSDRGLRDALTKWFGAPNATPIGGDHS